jgi:hypothetical protein
MPRRTDTDVAIRQSINAAHDAGHDLTELTRVTIRKGRRGLVTWATGTPPRHDHHFARAGEVVDVPAEAAIRFAVLGWVEGVDPSTPLAVLGLVPADTPAEEVEDLDALTGPPALGELLDGPDAPAADGEPTEGDLAGLLPSGEDAGEASDAGTDELLAMSAPELVAHLGRFPGDRDRVRDAELGQTKPRRTVLRAAGVADDELPA